MDFLTKANIEEWLVKTGFKRWHEGKDGWYMGKHPKMRFVDLSTEPPWVGIKTGYSSMEYEHDCEDVPLIREKILTIFNAKELAKNAEDAEKKKNDLKKSGVQVGEGNVISTKPLAELPSKPSPEAKKAPDESHKYHCRKCKKQTTKEQAEKSNKKYETIFCSDCFYKEEQKEESAQLKTNNCSECGLELNMLQAEEQYRKKIPVSKFKCEGCEEKQSKPLVDEIAHKKEIDHEIKKEAEGKQKEPEKEDKLMTENKLTVTPENRTPAKMSDAEIENKIEHAKAKRFLENRGAAYSVQGKERPDSHMIQNIANERNVSIEILEAIQDDKHCFVKVRAHLGEQYVDAVVNHDYEIEYQLKTMEIIKKNPDILDYWDGLKPVLKPDATIPILDRSGRKTGEESAAYYLIHALLSFRKFSMRDARTKSSAIASAMILNRDWRDPEEQDSEKAEASLVTENINKKV